MTRLYCSDSIDKLEMSDGLRECLKRAGCWRIDKLFAMRHTEWIPVIGPYFSEFSDLVSELQELRVQMIVLGKGVGTKYELVTNM